MVARIARQAEVVKILVFYDDPQLVYLKSDRDYPMFGLAISGMDLSRPFFACEAKERTSGRYFEGKVDLRYVFSEALNHRYYLFDLDEEENGTVNLKDADKGIVENNSFWPKIGFFSRSHTDWLNRLNTSGSAIRQYRIDGNWGAGDFSHFYGKMSDLYAIIAIMNRMDGKTQKDEKEFIRGAIKDRLWRGGGSYVGFYDELLEHAQTVTPLEVAKIEYASPGQIAFRGEGAVFDHLTDIVKVFDAESNEIAEKHRSIKRILQKEGLLSAPAETDFSSKALHGFVLKSTHELLKLLSIDKQNELLEACGYNVLVFAKVALSIYRRASELHQFRAQGRVQS